MTLYYILYSYLLPVLLLMFVIYIIGKPRFLITLLNKILLIPIYRIDIPLSAAMSFLLLIPMLQNSISYYSDKIELEEYLEHYQKYHHSNDFDKKYEYLLRKIFFKERNIFIIFCLMILIFIFVKFSSVYSKTFDVEDEIASLKDRIAKPEIDKKND